MINTKTEMMKLDRDVISNFLMISSLSCTIMFVLDIVPDSLNL